jgi:hypothetical protein
MLQVTNLRPNIKLAYDVYRLEDFGQYVRSWRHVAARRTRGSNQKDYMACAHVLLTAAGLVADEFEGEMKKRQGQQGQQG